ncbi:MAG: PEP-CTERM sorting domain-containing protein [Burkholderiales bacterium]|nr:PEP-CTERM sorting domain-containing protein [Burkholderiales bacterium]
MSISLRSLISAAVLAVGLPMAAHAGQVLLNFNSLPVGQILDSQYNDLAHGFTTFGNDAVSKGSVGAGKDGTNGGVVDSTGAVAMTVGDGFTSINFDYIWQGGSATGGASIFIFDAFDNQLAQIALSPSADWSHASFTEQQLGSEGSRVVFMGPAGAVAFDNISFDTGATTNVPEPASAALIALALAAAASTARRRKA